MNQRIEFSRLGKVRKALGVKVDSCTYTLIAAADTILIEVHCCGKMQRPPKASCTEGLGLS